MADPWYRQEARPVSWAMSRVYTRCLASIGAVTCWSPYRSQGTLTPTGRAR